MAEKIVTINAFGCTSKEQAIRQSRFRAVEDAAIRVGATRSDIFGLWIVPGVGELTQGQLLDLAARS